MQQLCIQRTNSEGGKRREFRVLAGFRVDTVALLEAID